MPLSSEQIAGLRKEYSQRSLRKEDVASDPIRQFALWLEEATRLELTDPNAMSLATVSADGRPSARIVLLKGLDESGFTFFTNYASRKGRDLAENPQAALVFHWAELERQVCIQGVVEKVSREVSEKYFHSRPHRSQLGALASRQSEVVEDRVSLENKFAEAKESFSEGEVPLPPDWGGFKLNPTSLEFWQGRRSRLHDRIRYRRENSAWVMERLSP